ncbi:ArsR/SmtB family transcription factor [Chloroflexota bacterium]
MEKEDEVKTEVLRLQAELCKSLSNPKRLHIIQELRAGERTVGELADILGLKQSNTSQHLAILRKINVVFPRKAGSMAYYKLAHPKIAEACDLVHEVIAEQLQNGQRLSRLMQ